MVFKSPGCLYPCQQDCYLVGHCSQVRKKSFWLNVRHHFILELYDQKVITMAYVPSARMRANVLTKYLPCTAFLRERAVLFNCVG